MEIVNGYPCFTCSDADYAKRGIDPSRPGIDQLGLRPDQPKSPTKDQVRDVNQPLSAGNRGTVLNLLT